MHTVARDKVRAGHLSRPREALGARHHFLVLAQAYYCITLHCMDSQLTLRIPTALARRLAAHAKATGAKRSQVVREALQAFLELPADRPRSPSVRERIGSYIGAVSLDRPSAERDDLARRLRSHNWRE